MERIRTAAWLNHASMDTCIDAAINYVDAIDARYLETPSQLKERARTRFPGGASPSEFTHWLEVMLVIPTLEDLQKD